MELIDCFEGCVPNVGVFSILGERGRYEKPIKLKVQKVRYSETKSGVEYQHVVTWRKDGGDEHE